MLIPFICSHTRNEKLNSTRDETFVLNGVLNGILHTCQHLPWRTTTTSSHPTIFVAILFGVDLGHFIAVSIDSFLLVLLGSVFADEWFVLNRRAEVLRFRRQVIKHVSVNAVSSPSVWVHRRDHPK